MTNIFTFLLGGLLVFYFMDINTDKIASIWQQAYQVGRDDGENLSMYQYKLSDEQLRYECERLHWEVLDGKQR